MSDHAIITEAGIQAALLAGETGPLVKIVGFTIGSQSQEEGAQALDTDTSVDGLVYTGGWSRMTYTITGPNSVLYTITLDQSIGDFDIGQVGLMLDNNVLFGKVVFQKQSFKTATNVLNEVIGNFKVLEVVVVFANLAALIDVSVGYAGYASLPEVDTELHLPAPLSAPYSAYLVHSHTHITIPVIATRYNGQWSFSPQQNFPTTGIQVLATDPSMYDDSVPIPCVVYFDTTTKKFYPCDGVDNSPAGIRVSSYQLVSSGMLPASKVGLTTPITPGKSYYLDSNNPGVLTDVFTAESGVICIAANPTDVWLTFNPNFGSTPDNLYGILATLLALIALNAKLINQLQLNQRETDEKIARILKDLSS